MAASFHNVTWWAPPYMVTLCWGLGTGSNFLLLPHKASSHRIHYGDRSPTGMCSGMKNLSLISPSSDSPLSKNVYKESRWGSLTVHYFPVTGINSWRKRTFLPSWKGGQVGWLQKHWECCEAARVLVIFVPPTMYVAPGNSAPFLPV